MPKVTVDVKVQDFTEEVKIAFKEQIQLGLEMIGSEAEGYAKDECPVDTGRLHNSISWATKDNKGNSDKPANPEDSQPKETPEEYTVYIGSNVEYAVVVEYGEKQKHTVGRAHFLRDAASTHGSKFKELMELALKT